MTHRRDPLTVHGVIDAAIGEAGGYALAAEIVGKSDKWLRNAANPHGDPQKTGSVTYAHARALTRAGVTALAHDLAGLLGCALVPLKALPADVTEVMAKSAALMAESGEAVGTIAAALADGKITPDERVAMRQQLMDVKRATAEALQALGDGG